MSYCSIFSFPFFKVSLAALLLACLVSLPVPLATAQDTFQDQPVEPTGSAGQPVSQHSPDKQSAVSAPQAAKQQTGRRTAVLISHSNADDAGTRLAFRLKEQFNKSSLFTLSDKDEKKIKILLTTREEFTSRPHLGSIYSAVWVFSARENVLTHYLESETGFVDTTTAEDLARKLTAKTDTIAVRYAYLFE